MKSFGALAALVTLASQVSALQVNTPSSVVQCEPYMFNWSGGTPPYYLSLIPAGQPSAPALKQFPEQQGTSYTWNVDLPAGTSFSTSITDSTGLQEFSAEATVQDSSDSSCINTSVQESGPTSGSSGASSSSSVVLVAGAVTTSSESAASGTSSGSVTLVGPSSTGSVSSIHQSSGTQSSGRVSATSIGSSAAASSNAATIGTSMNAFGFAGAMGVIGALLF